MNGFRRTTLGVFLTGLIAWGLAAVVVPAEPQPNKVGPFMRLKLEHAQSVLAGLALEDYEAISQNAQKISLLTQDENWQVLQTIDYRRHSDDFRRTANQLAEAARKKNLDGATLAYMQLTMQCVQCHKHVRGESKPRK